MWLSAWVCLFRTSRLLICRKWTGTYQCHYYPINSSISECDHQCDTRNAEWEIGTDGSRQTRRNPQVDGYGSCVAPPREGGSGFWTGLEPNWPVFLVQTRSAGGLPGPVANTNLQIALNTCYKDVTDTWWSKPVHWLSERLSPHCSASDCGCEHKLELEAGVAWASLLISKIDLWLSPKYRIQWSPPTLHLPGSMHHWQESHRSIEVVPILDLVDWENT